MLNKEKVLTHLQHHLLVYVLPVLKCCTIVNHIFSLSTKPLGLILEVTFTFSTPDCLRLLILYLSVVRPKLEYASAIWKFSTNCKQLECIKKKLVALCYYRLFSPDYNDHSYAKTLHTLNLNPLQEERRQLHASFAMHVFLSFKPCQSAMDFKFQVLKFPLGASETFLCLKLVRPSKAVPPPGVPLRQVQYVVTQMSSEGKTITLRHDIIISSLLQGTLIV